MMTSIRNRIYYKFKPLIPRRAQVWLRSRMARRQRARSESVWPILERAGRPPDGWPGWPEGRRFALVLVHDVELAVGQSRCLQLMQLEQALGFRSAFNFVPERYRVDPELRATLTRNGFEVGVHGLLHDGKLFESRAIFLARAQRINQYLREWQAVGFCSPSSHHQLDWMHDLDIEYDSSTFDTDPFEPQPDSLESIFPLWVSAPDAPRGYVELPYTLPQDFTLFVLLQEKSPEIWRRKLDWIAEKGGMAFIITHPDYMRFPGAVRRAEEYPVAYYVEFLEYVKSAYAGEYWHELPRTVAAYCQRQVHEPLYQWAALPLGANLP